MITIHNLRNEKPTEVYDVIVDRRSPLGNPSDMKHNENLRDKVCDDYKEWFKYVTSCWHEGKVVTEWKEQFHFIWRLILLHKEHGKLRLFCWCAPKRCHAETIKKYLEEK